MNQIKLSFIITTLSGLATLIGIIPIFIKQKEQDKIILSCLSLAAGIMLSVSILDLIPESLSLLSQSFTKKTCCLLSFVFINIGFLIAIYIDKIIPEKKITSLYKIGIISYIAIILHNIPEGMITFITTTKNTKLGVSLAISLALHNIPEGISIAIPIYYSTKSKKKAILYTVSSALSEPFGAILTYLILLPFINNIILGVLFSLIAGIMLAISLTELLPESLQYKKSKLTTKFFIIGITIMILKSLIEKVS